MITATLCLVLFPFGMNGTAAIEKDYNVSHEVNDQLEMLASGLIEMRKKNLPVILFEVHLVKILIFSQFHNTVLM